MSRKDLILIAVVINAGLLAVLFMTAMIEDPQLEIPPSAPVFIADASHAKVTPFTPIVEADPLPSRPIPVQSPVVDKPSLETYALVAPQQPVAPPSAPAVVSTLPPAATPKPAAPKEEAVYYVVKSGDNPWKIAKKCDVKVEDILRLNQFDDVRARNLKVGEKIRIK